MYFAVLFTVFHVLEVLLYPISCILYPYVVVN